MSSFLTQIRSAAAKRAAYRRTVAEISALSTEQGVEDLGIFPGDAHRIARKVVYGY